MDSSASTEGPQDPRPPLPPSAKARTLSITDLLDQLGSDLSLSDAVLARLVNVQQWLLREGYSFASANPSRWPACSVQMTKKALPILVVPWSPAYPSDSLSKVWKDLRKAKDHSMGLILVGDVPPEHPEVQDLFGALQGNVAYLDAAGGRFLHQKARGLVRTLPGFSRSHFSVLMRGGFPKSREIDCLERLRADIEAQEETRSYIERARSVSGKGKPLASYGVVSACGIVFLAMGVATTGQSLLLPTTDILIQWGANYGPLIRAGEWWRVITCGFLHVGFIHFFMNMVAMVIFGGQLELFQGRWRTGLIFFLSVIVASVASLLWDPLTPSAGASGGIFGVVGAIGGMSLRHWKRLPRVLRENLRRMLFTVLGYNLLLSMAPFIDMAAHAGGLLGGFLLALAISRDPSSERNPKAWEWGAVFLVMAATLGVGTVAVDRIPEDAPMTPPTPPTATESARLFVLQGLRRPPG